MGIREIVYISRLLYADGSSEPAKVMRIWLSEFVSDLQCESRPETRSISHPIRGCSGAERERDQATVSLCLSRRIAISTDGNP